MKKRIFGEIGAILLFSFIVAYLEFKGNAEINQYKLFGLGDFKIYLDNLFTIEPKFCIKLPILGDMYYLQSTVDLARSIFIKYLLVSFGIIAAMEIFIAILKKEVATAQANINSQEATITKIKTKKKAKFEIKDKICFIHKEKEAQTICPKCGNGMCNECAEHSNSKGNCIKCKITNFTIISIICKAVIFVCVILTVLLILRYSVQDTSIFSAIEILIFFTLFFLAIIVYCISKIIHINHDIKENENILNTLIKRDEAEKQL